MRYTGPTHSKSDDDRLMGLARVLLGSAEKYRQQQGLPLAKRTLVLPDGRVLIAKTSAAFKKVLIFSPTAEEREELISAIFVWRPISDECPDGYLADGSCATSSPENARRVIANLDAGDNWHVFPRANYQYGNVDWTNGDIVLSWNGRSGRYWGVTSYPAIIIGPPPAGGGIPGQQFSIFQGGKELAIAPSQYIIDNAESLGALSSPTHVGGAAVYTDEDDARWLIVVVGCYSQSYFFIRPFRAVYANNDIYDVLLNPLGWQYVAQYSNITLLAPAAQYAFSHPESLFSGEATWFFNASGTKAIWTCNFIDPSLKTTTGKVTCDVSGSVAFAFTPEEYGGLAVSDDTDGWGTSPSWTEYDAVYTYINTAFVEIAFHTLAEIDAIIADDLADRAAQYDTYYPPPEISVYDGENIAANHTECIEGLDGEYNVVSISRSWETVEVPDGSIIEYKSGYPSKIKESTIYFYRRVNWEIRNLADEVLCSGTDDLGSQTITKYKYPLYERTTTATYTRDITYSGANLVAVDFVGDTENAVIATLDGSNIHMQRVTSATQQWVVDNPNTHTTKVETIASSDTSSGSGLVKIQLEGVAANPIVLVQHEYSGTPFWDSYESSPIAALIALDARYKHAVILRHSTIDSTEIIYTIEDGVVQGDLETLPAITDSRDIPSIALTPAIDLQYSMQLSFTGIEDYLLFSVDFSGEAKVNYLSGDSGGLLAASLPGTYAKAMPVGRG